MNNKEYKEYMKELSVLKRKQLSSKSESRRVLIASGIYTPTGRLKKMYK